MIKDIKIDDKAGEIIITIAMQAPAPSASGKTLVVASTRGNVPIGEIGGKPAFAGINIYTSR